MSKIRINELARELEVKPHRIIDLLPELGVTEKKTHSSSIEDDVALKIRAYFGHEGNGAAREDRYRPDTDTDAEFEREPGDHEEREEREAAVPPPPQAEAEPRPPASAAVVETAPAVETAPVPAAPAPPAAPRPSIPLRPPLAGLVQTPPAPREAPPIPASVPPTPAPPQRTIAIPAKPVPLAPRPGQILSGPRQPMPAEPQRPPVAVTVPGAPVPGTVLPARPRPVAPPSASPAPGRPIAPPPRPQAPPPGQPLAGQPSARPVVPPRPDVLARIQQQNQQQAKPAPGQPTARPPMPGRPSAPPQPGQPIYRGPIRPGQPILRPGAQPGAPGAAARPQRGRPMHPTTPLRPEVATPVPSTEAQRREQAKRARERHREVEVVEKDLRFVRRQPEQVMASNKEITISEGITVKELSEKLGVKANLVIKKLVDRKIFATINQTLDVKLAENLAKDFGAASTELSFEEEHTFDIEMAEETADQQLRPPVVTIMGHVDHGKTSLLDAIRESNVVEGEFGGITQHIGAYQVDKNGRKITFIDTPGHEAFTRMRARGAKVTDIVILVVAADDGVMPQTQEAIDHARAAKVPIIVAVNKIDKPDANLERIKQQLTERGLMPEEWGGDTVMVPVSAKTRQNLDLLLEMILLVTDVQGFKANPNRPGEGTVLEAELDRGRGPVATVLVRKGTLRVSDYFICGTVFGRVRAMFDDRGHPIKEAPPSTPVEVLGLESVPDVGDAFQVVTDTSKAKQIVIYRESKARDEQMKKGTRVTLETLHKTLKEGETKELHIVLKADVGGTCEVLSDALQKLSTPKVKVRVLRTGVGAISESDVLLASTSDGIIVGFNVRPDKNAQAITEQEGVDIRLHTIIYELTDEIKKAMAGLLAPVLKEAYKGRAEVRDTFRITKVGTIAGCMVQDGTITRDSMVRLLRDNIVIFTGRIGSLKRFKDDASEVKQGYECGIGIANYNDIKPGDIIEAFITEKHAAEI
ncbi:MAG: translation initiation factor IF-2 [Bryobacteraceae bacterium]|nr:translation initiation factor IF-2 [Bryobacteraceae bacterium]